MLLQVTPDTLAVKIVEEAAEVAAESPALDLSWDGIIEMAIEYGIKILGAIVVLIIGFWVAKKLSNVTAKAVENRKLDEGLKTFLKSAVSALLKILVIITALSVLGVEMTSFVAFLGAAGLAVGMALSGALQNFAGGVMILIFKPFGVDDYIEAQGYEGFVKEIHIFNTKIKTLDGKIVIIPNAPLSSGAMVNVTGEPIRRVDLVFGIGYTDDIDKAKGVLAEVMAANDMILKDPAPDLFVGELADSSVNFTVRPWVKHDHYWDVYFYMHEQVKKAFDQQNISIPYPQMDVHMDQVSAN